MNEMIGILQKLHTSTESLATEIFEIVQRIRSVPIKKVKSPRAQQNKDFVVKASYYPKIFKFLTIKLQIAQLRMKLHLLQDEQEMAIAEKEFIKASSLQKELQEINEKLKEASTPEEETLSEDVELQSDDETMNRCLDLLIGVLNLSTLKTLPYPLEIFLEESLQPIIDQCSLIYKKVFKYIVLCGIVKRSIAEKYIQMICSPVS